MHEGGDTFAELGRPKTADATLSREGSTAGMEVRSNALTSHITHFQAGDS